MLRLLLLLVATFSLPWLAACGGGGGGGGAPPQGEVLVDFGNLSTAGGAVLAFEAPAAAFASGVAFDGEWRQGGVAMAPGRWASATTKHLVTVVPIGLTAGAYEVEITLGSARGRAAVQVAAAPVVSDPAASVQAFASEVVNSLATLRVDSQSLRDPAQAASLVADLDRLELVRANFESALATATAADLQLLATIMEATPSMASLLAVERGAGGVEANVTAVQLEVVTNTAVWNYGLGLVAAGVVIGVEFGWTGGGAVVAAGLILAGGVQMVAGVGGVTRAADLLMTAVTTLPMQWLSGSGPISGSGEVVIPSVLEGQAAGGLTLTVGVPFPLRASAAFATLSEADRTRPDSRLQSIFASMDEGASTQQGLAAAVTSVLQTPYPAVPAQPRIGTGTILGTALTIEAQSNPQVVLTLASGQLTASLQGASAPVTTTATFRYDSGPLGVLTQAVTVEVIAGYHFLVVETVTDTVVGAPMSGVFCGNEANVGESFSYMLFMYVDPTVGSISVSVDGKGLYNGLYSSATGAFSVNTAEMLEPAPVPGFMTARQWSMNGTVNLIKGTLTGTAETLTGTIHIPSGVRVDCRMSSLLQGTETR